MEVKWPGAGVPRLSKLKWRRGGTRSRFVFAFVFAFGVFVVKVIRDNGDLRSWRS